MDAVRTLSTVAITTGLALRVRSRGTWDQRAPNGKAPLKPKPERGPEKRLGWGLIALPIEQRSSQRGELTAKLGRESGVLCKPQGVAPNYSGSGLHGIECSDS